MDYEKFDFRERYNEVMFDERDIIEKFLKDLYDIRYGRQRDTWHFEPAIEVVSSQGSLVKITGIMLDTDKFVKFHVKVFGHGYCWLECTDFAYGELSKVIKALPDVNQILTKNAVSDIARLCGEYSVNLKENPFNTNINGKSLSITLVNYIDGHVVAYNHDGNVVSDKDTSKFLIGLRDHINIEFLHRSKEYKELMELLSLEENMSFECQNYGDVTFVIDGTDMTFDVSSVRRNDNGGLVIYGNDIDTDEHENIELTEKYIKHGYLVSIINEMKKKKFGIIDTYNGHNKELVRKINNAWKSVEYHDVFEGILHAILERDYEEYCSKYETPDVTTSDYAMNHAHEIMEGVCDDWDLETILSFIRYKE